jgi:hypothetical protein
MGYGHDRFLKMVRLLTHPDEARQMGRQAQKLLQEHFAAARMAAQTPLL